MEIGNVMKTFRYGLTCTRLRFPEQGTWTLHKPESYFAPTTEWRQSPISGEPILINLIHEIDLLHYMFGSIASVSALETRKGRGFEVEEGPAVLLGFESSVVDSFVFCDAAPSPWNFEAGTGENPTIPHVQTSAGAGGFYRVLGSKASLSVPDMTRWSYDDVGERKEKGWGENLTRERLEVDNVVVPFDAQIEHFIDGSKETSCSGEEGLRAVVVVKQ